MRDGRFAAADYSFDLNTLLVAEVADFDCWLA